MVRMPQRSSLSPAAATDWGDLAQQPSPPCCCCLLLVLICVYSEKQRRKRATDVAAQQMALLHFDAERFTINN